MKTKITLSLLAAVVLAGLFTVCQLEDVPEEEVTITFDCFAKGTYPTLQGVKKGMDLKPYTLPKQHTSSLQGEVVDSNGGSAVGSAFIGNPAAGSYWNSTATTDEVDCAGLNKTVNGYGGTQQANQNNRSYFILMARNSVTDWPYHTAASPTTCTIKSIKIYLE